MSLQAETGERRESAAPRITSQSVWASDTAWVIYLALTTVVVHVITGRQFGFHRDELATLEDARHLAWGYVAYPPILAVFWTALADTFFWDVACRLSIFRSTGASTWRGAHRTDGSPSWAVDAEHSSWQPQRPFPSASVAAR